MFKPQRRLYYGAGETLARHSVLSLQQACNKNSNVFSLSTACKTCELKDKAATAYHAHLNESQKCCMPIVDLTREVSAYQMVADQQAGSNVEAWPSSEQLWSTAH